MTARKVMTSTHISLRKLTSKDSQFVLSLTTDKSWLQNIGDRGVTDTASASQFIEDKIIPLYATQGLGLMGVEDRELGCLVGLCGLLQREYFDFPDLGFALLPQFRGQGYMIAAAKITLQNPLARKSKIILATTLPSNIASIKTLRKLGFDGVGDIEVQNESVKLLMLTNYQHTRTPDECVSQ